jgi:hypothetical protein
MHDVFLYRGRAKRNDPALTPTRYTRSATSLEIDPRTARENVLLSDFPGGTTWPGTGAASGVSGAVVLGDAFALPTKGEALNGHPCAVFAGGQALATNGTGGSNHTLASIISTTASSGVCVVEFTSLVADPGAGSRFQAPAVIDDNSGTGYYVTFHDGGIAFGLSSDLVAYECNNLFAIATGTKYQIQWRHDGVEMRLRVNNGAWSTLASEPMAAGLLASALRLGQSTGGFANVKIWFLSMVNEALSLAEFDRRGLYNQRYFGVSFGFTDSPVASNARDPVLGPPPRFGFCDAFLYPDPNYAPAIPPSTVDALLYGASLFHPVGVLTSTTSIVDGLLFTGSLAFATNVLAEAFIAATTSLTGARADPAGVLAASTIDGARSLDGSLFPAGVLAAALLGHARSEASGSFPAGFFSLASVFAQSAPSPPLPYAHSVIPGAVSVATALANPAGFYGAHGILQGSAGSITIDALFAPLDGLARPSGALLESIVAAAQARSDAVRSSGILAEAFVGAARASRVDPAPATGLLVETFVSARVAADGAAAPAGVQSVAIVLALQTQAPALYYSHTVIPGAVSVSSSLSATGASLPVGILPFNPSPHWYEAFPRVSRTLDRVLFSSETVIVTLRASSGTIVRLVDPSASARLEPAASSSERLTVRVSRSLDRVLPTRPPEH